MILADKPCINRFFKQMVKPLCKSHIPGSDLNSHVPKHLFVVQAQAAAQTAAKRYDRAISSHQAAQQMVSVAEVGFKNSARAASSLANGAETSSASSHHSSSSSDSGSNFQSKKQKGHSFFCARNALHVHVLLSHQWALVYMAE